MATKKQPHEEAGTAQVKLSDKVPLRRRAGRDRRSLCARSALATIPDFKRDPIEIIKASNVHRLQRLIPIRYGRMLHSPFAFMRGSVSLMAHDIASLPTPGIVTQICGDCHLGNFGGFASPERALLFGLNDFDETIPGNFEWDLKRLAASFVVAARQEGISDRRCEEIVRSLARTYRTRMAEVVAWSPLDLWYQRIEVNTLIETARSVDTRRRRQQMADDAVNRTADHAFPKMVEEVKGRLRIRDHRPLIYHANHIADFHSDITHFWRQYVLSMPEERRVLLNRYEVADVAIKVVGVGSVGTRCAIALLMSAGNQPLFLQFKEAQQSVYETSGGKSTFRNHGQRVVIGQRLLQAASDIFLGWARAEHIGVDFYVRQLRDMKVSLDFGHMTASDFLEYAEACGWVLARAHAKAGDAALIAGYLGTSPALDQSLVKFALQYADQNEHDFELLAKAAKSGRIVADMNEATSD